VNETTEKSFKDITGYEIDSVPVDALKAIANAIQTLIENDLFEFNQTMHNEILDRLQTIK
jgi:hypothetical protein